jgi:hypothetical protein
MNKKELTERLCELVTRVGVDVFNSQVPHECFCGTLMNDNPIVDKSVVDFIENAVASAIRDRKKA